MLRKKRKIVVIFCKKIQEKSKRWSLFLYVDILSKYKDSSNGKFFLFFSRYRKREQKMPSHSKSYDAALCADYDSYLTYY